MRQARYLLRTLIEAVHRLSFSHFLSYHAYTIWLFTRSDLKSIVGPETAFAVICALSGPVLTTGAAPPTLDTIKQTVVVAFWVWINLLPLDIANQRQPKAIEEDSINKPWRAMPSKRLSFEQARGLMLFSYFLAGLTSLCFGGWGCFIILILLGFHYNKLGGADDSAIVRNLLNAAGFLTFAFGASEVASKNLRFSLNHVGYQWFFIVGAIVFSTIHAQDMPDQEGDSARGRRTAPLVLGDMCARWTIAIPVVFWSFFCPYFMGLLLVAYAPSVLMGGILAYRIVRYRTVAADKRTFGIWNLWIVTIYLLPLIKRLSL